MNIFVSMPMNGKTDEEIITKMQEFDDKFSEDHVICGYIDTKDMLNILHNVCMEYDIPMMFEDEEGD